MSPTTARGSGTAIRDSFYITLFLFTASACIRIVLLLTNEAINLGFRLGGFGPDLKTLQSNFEDDHPSSIHIDYVGTINLVSSIFPSFLVLYSLSLIVHDSFYLVIRYFVVGLYFVFFFIFRFLLFHYDSYFIRYSFLS